MQPSALVLLPPILVLICATITRRLQSSLLFGLICGAFIATQWQPIAAAQLVFERIFTQISDRENLYVYLFLLCVGIVITVINHTGAAYALANYAKAHIKRAKQVERSTFVISLLLALDDYLNCLTVGYVLRPLADRFGIARCKMAYLVHTFAGPLVLLVPISTWAAFVTSQLDQSGISAVQGPGVKIIADPFYVYLGSIPFIYYAILTIATAFIIINRSLSFGPMQRFEHESKKANHTEQTTQINTKAQLSDLLIPLGTLFATVFLGMLYMGDYWLLGGSQSLVGAFKTNQDAFLVLGVSSVITVLVSMLLGYWRTQITADQIPMLVYEGLVLMGPAVMLVILASTLGSILRLDLQTGQYLASLLLHTMQIIYLPIIFFVVAVITSTMIGTAWGTIALLLPIGIPMAHSLIKLSSHDVSALPILLPAIGAILAGATFGDHTSPISAAVIMASTSAGCDPVDHINTQYPYAIPPLLGSCVAFFITGLLTGYAKWFVIGISLSAGIVVTMITLQVSNNILSSTSS